MSICEDYAKFTSTLLLNIYPESELCFVRIPEHVATAIKINNKMYVLDQKLPVLTVEDWVQMREVQLKKTKFYKIIKDGESLKTKPTEYTERTGQINKINTTKIVEELKKKLKIKEVDKSSDLRINPLKPITISLKNYAYLEEDEITEFSVIESIKNKIEDELVGDFKEIFDLTLDQKDKDLVLKIQLVGERNEA